MNGIENLSNIELEEHVIAACLADCNIFTALSDKMNADIFSDRESRVIYEIMQGMEKSGDVIDVATVGMTLYSRGISLTRFIKEEIPSFEVTRRRVEILTSLEFKRRIYNFCVQGITMATTPASDVSDINRMISNFTSEARVDLSRGITFKDSVKMLTDDIVKRKEGKIETGIRTGLNIFDKRNGLHGGDLVIIAGETSNGKSTLATTIARNVAIQGIPVVYYSLEMGAVQLTARILARDVMVASSRLLYAQLTDEEFNSYYDATLKRDELPIYFDDESKTNFQKLCSSARSMARRKGVKIIFIDYLQILVNGEEGSREQILGDMARDLKRLAVDTNACVVALSQLSRDPSNRGGEPSLSRMRGSGQIEEACDMAVLIHRPSLYGKEKYDDGTVTAGTAQLKLAKGRNVGIGSDIVIFDGDLTYFRNDDGNRAMYEDKVDLPFT